MRFRTTGSRFRRPSMSLDTIPPSLWQSQYVRERSNLTTRLMQPHQIERARTRQRDPHRGWQGSFSRLASSDFAALRYVARSHVIARHIRLLDVNGKSSDRIGIGILPTVIRSRRQIARLARRPSSDGELVVDRL